MLEKKKRPPVIPTSQIIDEISLKFQMIPKYTTKKIVKLFLEKVEKNVAEGNAVRIFKVGILKTRIIKARNCRNPQTGEKFIAPEHLRVKFKISSVLKKTLR